MKISCFIQNDDENNYLVYKYDKGEILNNSVLIVSESEVAVFVKDGTVTNVFTYGRYTLTTNKYPLIINVQKKLFENVSSVCVYFIKINDIVNLEWGTNSPIQMIDYKYGFSVNLRANGVYSFRISNPQKTLTKLIGLDSSYVTISKFDLKFKQIFVSHIKTELALYMKNNNLSIMEMNTEYFNISNEIKGKLSLICEDYGLELINFQINDISIPHDDPNYAQINDAIVKQSIFNMQGSSFKEIAEKEKDLLFAKNSNLSTIVNIGNNNENGNSCRCSCGATINDGMQFCPNCGRKIVKSLYCSNCGEKLLPDVKFCSNCGKGV